MAHFDRLHSSGGEHISIKSEPLSPPQCSEETMTRIPHSAMVNPVHSPSFTTKLSPDHCASSIFNKSPHTTPPCLNLGSSPSPVSSTRNLSSASPGNGIYSSNIINRSSSGSSNNSSGSSWPQTHGGMDASLDMLAPQTKPDTRTALKSSILKKRKDRGETSLPSVEDEPREYKLTKREIERKETRREQNRRAARKCRLKKKKIQQDTSKEMENAMKENVEMKREVETLKHEVTRLQQIISDHAKNDNCKLHLNHSLCGNNKAHHNPLQPQVYSILEQAASDTLGLLPTNIPVSSTSTPCNQNKANIIAPEFTTSDSVNNNMINNNDNTNTTTSNNMRQESLLCESGTLHSKSPFMECSEFVTPTNHLVSTGSCSGNSSFHSKNIDCRSNGEQNLLSWDFNNLTSDLLSEQENPENIQLDVNAFLKNCRDEENTIRWMEADSQKSSSQHKTDNNLSKPRVVRDLNMDFLQSDQLHGGRVKGQLNVVHKKNVPRPITLPDLEMRSPQGTINNSDSLPDASSYLLDPNLSSPIFNCVSPNLVQQPPLTPLSRVSPAAPLQAAPDSSSTPYEVQAFLQYLATETHSDPVDHINQQQIPVNPEILSENIPNDQLLDIIEEHMRAMEVTYPVPPPEALFLECGNNNNNNNNNNRSTSTSISTSTPTTVNNNSYESGGFSPPTPLSSINCSSNTTTSNISSSSAYSNQFSPLSTPSPSNASNLSSPGFLQNSPYELCVSNSMFEF